MEATMVEVVLVSVTMEGILKKLDSLDFEEVNRSCGLKGELLEELSRKLVMIQAVLHDAEGRQVREIPVLHDAEGRQVRENPVRVWLKNLRSIAHDADDLVDKFSFEILQNRMGNKVHNFFSIAFRFKIVRKVKNINMNLDQIYREANVFRLEEGESTETITDHGESQLTHLFVDDLDVVGRDNDISEIVDMLIINSDNEEDLPIIAIVGKAGIGKTTLAQQVYKKEIVMRHFDERMWVSLSADFDVKRFLKEMLESLTIGSCGVSKIEAIIKELEGKLNGKKYLLVLDDLRNIDADKWECMRKSLLGIGASRGSRILVTTDSDEAVSVMQNFRSHRLLGLSEEYSWFLFKQRAFANGGAEETQDLVDVGRRIVVKCGGFPLEIRTLGALMHSKREEHEWLSVEHSEVWNLPEGERRTKLLLRLSFDELTPCLKQCFMYCSIFSKDCTIEKENLIQLWMAQGFLQPPGGSDLEMEDIGNDNFKVLLWNSLFQDVEMDGFGNITNCKMHDLVHDLAVLTSGSQCLTLGSGVVNDNCEARHLSLISNGEIRLTTRRKNVKKMRTLILRDDVVLKNLLVNLKCLRVLNLNGANIKKLPTSIGKLKLLRYLDVSRTSIKVFPKSICKLYNLQTLRLMDCKSLEELPNDLKYLISLRHIYFNDRSQWFGLDGERYTRQQMPIEMGWLTCLQTLPLFFVGWERGRQIEELGCLNKLRGKLKICNLEHVRDKEEAARAKLVEKTNLYKLEFEWRSRREGNNNDEDVLEGLQPQPNLKSLTVENFEGDRFPSWMIMTAKTNNSSGLLLHGNLVEMKLINCVKCEQIPALGKLPFLRVLEIEGMDNVKCVGTEFYGYSNDGASGSSINETSALFPALKRFKLRYMHNLVEWMGAAAMPAGRVVFPCLEELSVQYCHQLTTAPTHFSSVKELKISSVESSMPLSHITSNLTTLTSLRIDLVSGLSFFPEGLLQNNQNLAYLGIWDCPSLNFIVPHVSGCCSSLRSLDIGCCAELYHLPDGLYTLASLEELTIIHCRNLQSIPCIHGLTSLRTMKILGCNRLTSLPSGLESCTSLEFLTIQYCSNLISVPEDLRELCSLSSLTILGCEKLKSLPEGLHCLTRLKALEIGGFCNELDSFPKFELHLPSLRDLMLSGWPKLKSLPDQLQNLTALTSLGILEFAGVEALPEWLGNLTSLERLLIFRCQNLKYLPTVEAIQRLTKLQNLEIHWCPHLWERCAKGRGSAWFKKGQGQEWFKISHIPTIMIDNVSIQSQAA